MKTLQSTLLLLTLLLFGAVSVVHSSNAYPLTTCVVSGEKLDEMGKPIIMNYQGTEVRFCCKDCITKFQTNPAHYLAKLKIAPAAH